MKTKKLVAIIISIIICAVIAVGIYYFAVYKKGGKPDDYSKLTENMQAWTVSDTSGMLLYVPEDYTETENDFYGLYCKDDARIKLTYQDCDNDLANYSINAITQYKNITDAFTVNSEFDEVLSSDTIAHIVEFDYSLSLDSGVKHFSCLSAFVIANGKAYVLTCTCDSGNYSKYKDDFYKTYKSMRAVMDYDQK